MPVLKWILSNGVAAVDRPDIIIPPEGVVLTGEIRPSQDRNAGDFVAVHDPTMSSGFQGHCRIWVDKDHVLICDSGSDNGTWVVRDNVPVSVGNYRQPAPISANTEIIVGRTCLRLAIP